MYNVDDTNNRTVTVVFTSWRILIKKVILYLMSNFSIEINSDDESRKEYKVNVNNVNSVDARKCIHYTCVSHFTNVRMKQYFAVHYVLPDSHYRVTDHGQHILCIMRKIQPHKNIRVSAA